MDDAGLAALRCRVLAEARAADRRRRRRHRTAAVLSAVVAAALVTAGAVVLTAPSPPEPLGAEEEFVYYEASIEAHWADLEKRYPDAVRPEAAFERFVTRDEERAVLTACLREQGIDVAPDGSTSAPSGAELEHELAHYVCAVRFPLTVNEYLPYTDDELRHIYRYYVEQLTPCLEGRGYEIGEPPTFDEFRARWWTNDTWGPYRDVVESDADAFRETEAACPPMPADLRP